MNKIGVGIVTYNREFELKRLYDSLPLNLIDSLVIVNDGNEVFGNFNSALIINNEKNIGVGRSKNKAIAQLLDHNVDYIFIIEDDLFIKDKDVFDKYIIAHQVTGIHHFNYALHGLLNINILGNSNQKLDVIYDNEPIISLYENCVGAFSFFTRECLEQVALFDEQYYNALEHVDHTFQLISKGFHPPFWYFADICNSNNYIGDDGWNLKTSVISNNSDINDIQDIARGYFFFKNKVELSSIPVPSSKLVLSCLKFINKKHGNKSKIFYKKYLLNFYFNKIFNRIKLLLSKLTFYKTISR